MRRFDQTNTALLLKAMEPIAHCIVALARNFGNLLDGVTLRREQHHLKVQLRTQATWCAEHVV